MAEASFSRRAFVQGGGLALAGAATGLASGCGDVSGLAPELDEISTGAAGRPNRGGVLRYGLSTDPANFDPHISAGTASDIVRQLLYNTLLQFSDDGEIVSDLAAEHGWVSPRTYEVRLRDGVRFHDGSPLTPQDVAYSFRRMKDPDVGASAAPMLEEMERVEVADRSTVLFRLTRANYALPAILAYPSANIVSQRWMESGADPKTTAMGTGAFRFDERIPGVSTTLVRNDEYFVDGQPYLNAIQFVPMPEDYSRVVALRSATVDMIDYVPTTHIDAIRSNPRLRFASDNTIGFGYIAFVCNKPPFNDVRVRQAVAHSLDRERMLQTAYLGHGEPMTGGLQPEGRLGHNAELNGTYTYDPERTTYLLRKAGVDRLNFPMLATSTYSVQARPAEAALPAMQVAGLGVNLTRLEWSAYLVEQETHQYAVRNGGTNPAYADPDALRDFFGSKGTHAGYMHFSDPRIDDLLAQGRSTRDDGLRDEIYQEIDKRVTELVPWTYTLRREQGEAYNRRVRGYAHPPEGMWTSVSLRRTWLEERG